MENNNINKEYDLFQMPKEKIYSVDLNQQSPPPKISQINAESNLKLNFEYKIPTKNKNKGSYENTDENNENKKSNENNNLAHKIVNFKK